VVAQDQDYLNVICKDRVYYFDYSWNYGIVAEDGTAEEDIHIIHYNLSRKPWHYRECRLGQYFWQYAEKTEVCGEIQEILANYTEEEMKNDDRHSENLYSLAAQEISREDNYRNLIKNMDIDYTGRRAIVEKIAQYEREGRFDEDVEEDPPSRTLNPDEIEYTKKPWMKRMRTRFAYKMASWFVNYLIKEKKFILKEFRGIENMSGLTTGAIFTCNHFSAMDSFAMDLTFNQSMLKLRGKKMYRIIREGNYTSFPGFYGFLMRNCNTLPLSSNKDTMRKLLTAVDEILSAGNYILIYPEQSMWWNYRKPKPLKKSAYKFAAKNNVPVLPVFITMEDSDVIEEEDFYVQEYTVHVGEPIYPDKSLSVVENAKVMLEKNYEWWKKVYEDFYGTPLEYSCGEVDCNGVVRKM
jgi:1-acyl-sn-glycerol-3-phosphate acyltransferase